jgi:aryl-alcohol dehydrogenase-like predicted oxidoreductase
MTALGTSGLDVSTLCLGTNVFGWTADEAASHDVLDSYVGGGGNFIDTADVYSAWIPGNSGGESETIIGTWLAANPAKRDDLVVATKVSQLAPNKGLGRDAILAGCDASLERLQTDRIDLYWAHYDDAETKLEETLSAFAELIAAGKVRAIGASNYSAARLAEALALSDRKELPKYVALQPHYNLVERDEYEATLAPVVAEHEIAVVPYFGLAKGFLTGKYRAGGDAVDSPRAGSAAEYLERPDAVAALEAAEAIADARGISIAAVALAWLAGQPHVAAPIASARTVDQLADLLPVNALSLTESELAALSAATADAA